MQKALPPTARRIAPCARQSRPYRTRVSISVSAGARPGDRPCARFIALNRSAFEMNDLAATATIRRTILSATSSIPMRMVASGRCCQSEIGRAGEGDHARGIVARRAFRSRQASRGPWRRSKLTADLRDEHLICRHDALLGVPEQLKTAVALRRDAATWPAYTSMTLRWSTRSSLAWTRFPAWAWRQSASVPVVAGAV